MQVEGILRTDDESVKYHILLPCLRLELVWFI